MGVKNKQVLVYTERNLDTVILINTIHTSSFYIEYTLKIYRKYSFIQLNI